MKKNTPVFLCRKAFSLILIMVFTLPLLASCGKLSSDAPPRTSDTSAGLEIPPVESYSVNRFDGCIYGDYYFFEYSGKLYFYKLNDVQSGPLPVYFDPLASGNDDPFNSLGSISFFTIDTAASAKNGGVPVILFLGDYLYTVETAANQHRVIIEYKIGSFNMKTQELKILKDGIEGIPMNFAVHGDRILYVIHTEENGSTLHSIRTSDGGDEKFLPNSDKSIYRLSYAWDGRIYYMKSGEVTLQSCDLNFEDQRSHFPIGDYPEPFIYDGKLYYSAYQEFPPLEQNDQFRSYDICCRDLSDPENEETLLSDVLVGVNRDNLYFYYSDSNYNAVTRGHDVLYCLDLNTRESRTVFDKSNERNNYLIQGFNERWIVLAENDFYGDGGTKQILCLDLKSGKETVLPKNHLNW